MPRKLTDIDKIIVHCSDSKFGDIGLIDRWHRENGWRGCGYHYVITNGVTTPGKPYNKAMDGLIQVGRKLSEIGAHCKGQNAESIGICLIGRHHFSGRQLLQALPRLLLILGRLGLKAENVFGHQDFSSRICPSIDTTLLRRIARQGGMK